MSLKSNEHSISCPALTTLEVQEISEDSTSSAEISESGRNTKRRDNNRAVRAVPIALTQAIRFQNIR
jgi:hypothetical protein